MGIQDREYIRRRPSRSRDLGAAAAVMGMWSVNTWIIAICVSIFVVDGLLPTRFTPSGNYKVADNVQVDEDQLRIVPKTVDERTGRTIWLVSKMVDSDTGREMFVVPLVDSLSGRRVGWAEVLPMRPIESWLYFSTNRLLRLEWWRLIGFQFLHAHGMFLHIVFNMLGLYFFGPMVEQYLGSKRYLAFYLLCGIFGALMYLLLNLGGYVVSQVAGTDVRIPGLLFNDITTPLIGASAGVFGVIMAGAYLAPNAIVYVFFVLPARLATVAYLLVAMSLFSLLTSGHNAGGEAAHLGGALAGMYFIRRPRHLHGFFDILGRADPTSHHYSDRRRRSPKRQEIDRILTKISRSSIHSLTSEEKRTLQEASEQ